MSTAAAPVDLSKIDRSLQHESLRIIYAFEVLAAVFVLLRVWSRFLLARGSWTGLMRWSDICLGIAFLLSIGETLALALVTQRAGLGLRTVDMIALTPKSLATQVTTNQWNLANQLLYNPILGFIKFSALFLFLRLIGNKTQIRNAIYGIMAFNTALMIATFISDCLQCLPFTYNWDKPYMDIAAQKAAGADPLTGMKNGVLITGGKCFDQRDFYVATAGLSLLTDVMVMAIPIWMVWGLQMKMKKKMIVVGILTLGSSVTAVGIARLPIVYHMFTPTTKDPFHTIGFTTTAMETGLAIATACVPDLAPLLSRILPQYFGSTGTPSGYPSNPGRKGYMNNSSANAAFSGVRSGNNMNMKDMTRSQVRATGKDSLEGSEEDDVYALQGWRGDGGRVNQGNVVVKGGVSQGSVSRHGSQEAIVPGKGEKGGIVKTTQFVITQDDSDEDGKRWSAV